MSNPLFLKASQRSKAKFKANKSFCPFVHSYRCLESHCFNSWRMIEKYAVISKSQLFRFSTSYWLIFRNLKYWLARSRIRLSLPVTNKSWIYLYSIMCPLQLLLQVATGNKKWEFASFTILLFVRNAPWKKLFLPPQLNHHRYRSLWLDLNKAGLPVCVTF